MAEVPGRILFYHRLLMERGWYLGRWEKGEIEIIFDLQEINEIERRAEEKLKNDPQGMIPSWWVGIISWTHWFIHLRDAVIFPDGVRGLYERIVYANETFRGIPPDPGGMSILPVTRDGRVILTAEFRHSCRAWIMGSIGATTRFGESHEDAIRRSLVQNLGVKGVKEIHFLGDFISDRGLLGTPTPIYLASVNERKLNRNKCDPAIGGWGFVSFERYLEMRKQGWVFFPPVRKNCLVCDGYTDSAVILAKAFGFI